jgi:hypothetical protein
MSRTKSVFSALSLASVLARERCSPVMAGLDPELIAILLAGLGSI